MKTTILAIAVALASIPAAGAAQEADNVEALAGDFRIVHLWTTDPEAFLEAWKQPTPPTLATTTRTQRNRPIQQFIIFGNCRANEAGDCHLTARVDITAPDGSPYGEPMVFEALPPSPAPPRGRLILAPASIGFQVEDGEQLGTYRVALAVTDEVSAQTATSRISLQVDEEMAD